MDPKNDKQEGPPDGQKVPVKGLLVWIFLLTLFMVMFQFMSRGTEQADKIPYSPDFLGLVEEGRIQSAEMVLEASGSRYIVGQLTDVDAQGQPVQFKVYVTDADSVTELLAEKKVPFEVKPFNPLLTQLLTSMIPLILIIGLLYFLFTRQMKMAGRGAMSFGKSRARLLTRGKNKITFKDVAGVEEAKDELSEVVDFLKDPKRFQKLGGRIPKGVLLVGPPGTGKTLLAKSIAGEANVPFFSISGSDFVEMFVGVGASRVRDMFEQGRKSAPCIIFIDEIDAVGRSRFSGIGGGHDEREQTLNALLVEMDGFDTQEGIIIIAATNRPDVLDNALLRPGRFDRQVYVDLPTLEGREEILKIHVKKIKLGRSVDLRRVARGTPGFSGADLANLCNEAALLAARRGAEEVEIRDLEEARDKVRWGRERRSRLMDDHEKRITAYHEAGHAIVLHEVEESEPLHKVTIIPRGQSLGATIQLPEKDRYTQGRKRLLGMLAGLMGGRVAEEMACDDITTGAQNDILQATRIARAMVCEWGMSDKMGMQAFGNNEEVLFLGREVARQHEISEETSRQVDAEVARLLKEGLEQARHILSTHREKLDLLANVLLERETLDGDDVDELLAHGRLLSEVERTERRQQHKDAEAEGSAPTTVPETPPPVKAPPVLPPSSNPSPA